MSNDMNDAPAALCGFSRDDIRSLLRRIGDRVWHPFDFTLRLGIPLPTGSRLAQALLDEGYVVRVASWRADKGRLPGLELTPLGRRLTRERRLQPIPRRQAAAIFAKVTARIADVNGRPGFMHRIVEAHVIGSWCWAEEEVTVVDIGNPEFLREGAAIRDFKHPDCIVVGTTDERARKVMTELYRPLYLNQAPLMFTARGTAELIKYAANAFLATKITFINELADLCEQVGGDVQEVARGIGLDNRIGSKFLHAGPGYGGSCFPKDTLALIKTAQDNGTPLRIVETVAAVNDQRKRAMARKVAAALGGSVRDKTIAVLGLTFKPNTDDMRDAPSIPLVTAFNDMGAKVRAYDPAGMEQAKRDLDGLVTFCANAYECAQGADAVVIVTEWEQFRALDLDRLKSAMRQPVMVDLRNVYRADEMAAAGFAYSSVGRAIAPGHVRS